jgi:uncharacterized protein DUF6401
MSSTFDATTNATTRAAARQALDDLMAWVGVDGLVAALRCPGLLATVDQHAAAVRDAVTARYGRICPAGLAGYGRSVLAAAHRHGCALPTATEPVGDLDWSRAGWHLLRLVAVCLVADQAGCL